MTNDDQASRRVEAARAWDGTIPPTWSPEHVGELVPQACSDPLVTVIIPCHDDGIYLLDALASVRLCLDERPEVIVVDDHSTDPVTLTILQTIRDAGVTVVESHGWGPSAARNTALAMAQTDAVLPLDADNLLRPGFIDAAIRKLSEDPERAAVHADAMWFGAESGPRVTPQPAVADLLCGNKLDTFALVRRSALTQVGGWDPEVVGSEDWSLWVTLVDAGWQLARVPMIGCDYRVRPGSLRSTLTPEVRAGHLAHLVHRHPEIYRTHIEAVVANLAGAAYRNEASAASGVGDDAEGRRAADHIAALEAALEAAETNGAQARHQAACAKRDLDEADELRAATESQRVVIEAELARTVDALRATERLVAAYEDTKVFRLMRVPRAVYARLRSVLGR